MNIPWKLYGDLKNPSHKPAQALKVIESNRAYLEEALRLVKNEQRQHYPAKYTSSSMEALLRNIPNGYVVFSGTCIDLYSASTFSETYISFKKFCKVYDGDFSRVSVKLAMGFVAIPLCVDSANALGYKLQGRLNLSGFLRSSNPELYEVALYPDELDHFQPDEWSRCDCDYTEVCQTAKGGDYFIFAPCGQVFICSKSNYESLYKPFELP